MPKRTPNQDQRLKDKLRIIAREMRHEPTPAEELLWQRLRDRQLSGHRFHRQHRIDRFIVDFCCPRSGLVVEVDGEIHQQQVEADQERDRILKGLGYRVLRFANAQVLGQMDQVLLQILDAFEVTPSPKSGFDDFGEGAGG